jgi:phosphotransferase system  glucose/maltose/N-acetylglucosamine-specific IIC component
MSITFFIVGAIIFAIYLMLMLWNIVDSNKKQREENYPNIDTKEILEKKDEFPG